MVKKSVRKYVSYLITAVLLLGSMETAMAEETALIMAEEDEELVCEDEFLIDDAAADFPLELEGDTEQSVLVEEISVLDEAEPVTMEGDETGEAVVKSENEQQMSGMCDTDVTWTFDAALGLLTISGTGTVKGTESASTTTWHDDLEKNAVKRILIGEGITAIDQHTFYAFRSLTSVELPDSIERIGGYAFSSCKALKEINLPDRVTSIGKSAFSSCSALTEIALPQNLTSIGNSVFAYCKSLETVILPERLTSMGTGAFMYCTSLKNIDLPESLTSMDIRAFEGCSALTGIIIPTNLTSLPDYIFYGCTSLEWIKIPKSVKTIKETAFSDTFALNEIYGYMETAAAQYAAQKGCSFVDLSAVAAALSQLPDLSELTLEHRAAVNAARSEYDKITVKKCVDAELTARLTAAEAKIAELEAANHIHAWDNGTITKAATCKETGMITYYCSCGESQTESIPLSTVHTYDAGKIVTAATVFAAQVQKYTCTICGAEKTQSVGGKLTPILEVPGKLSTISMKKGSSNTFAVTMANGDSVSSVRSSKTSILKADLNKKTGKIKLQAVKAGTAKLTIKLASTKSKTYTVKVTNSTVKTTALSVTSVTNKKLTLAKGKTHSLKTTVKPFTSTQKLTYTSSNKKTATVTSAGKIKAVAAGKAVITVKSGSKSVKITVTVPGITDVKNSVTVKKGKTLTLSPKTYGISEKVTYTSSNKKIATVTSKGKIKGIKKGTAKITIKAGNYKKTVTVKVN